MEAISKSKWKLSFPIIKESKLKYKEIIISIMKVKDGDGVTGAGTLDGDPMEKSKQLNFQKFQKLRFIIMHMDKYNHQKFLTHITK